MDVRIYIEGGGDQNATRRRLRQAFSQFLSECRDAAREHQCGFKLIVCGGRDQACDMFLNSPIARDEMRVLLVDSEGPVSRDPKQHLAGRDNWPLTGVDDDQCHLMVQLMESWFLADVEALENYYGQAFARGSLPRNPHIEEIAKKDVEEGLETATRHTQKGRYHKTRHAPELLERIHPTKVRQAASHCERLFATLLEFLMK